MAKTHSKTEVVISVGDSHLGKMQDVVRRLRTKGLDVSNVMEEIGTITGSIETEKVESLTQVSGVVAVEESRSYQLPPPDSEVQ